MQSVSALVALIFSVALSSQAFAKSYSVSLKQTVKEATAVYQKTDDLGYYEQISNYSVSDQVLRGEGPLRQLSRTDRNVVDEKVVGRDINGYSYVSVERVSDSEVYVIYELKVDDTIDGIKFQLENKYRAPAEFTKGSWSSYEAGEKVKIELTEEGEEISANATVATLKYALRQLKNSLQAQGVPVGKIKLEDLEIKSPGVLTGTINQLVYDQARVVIEISFEVEL